MRKSIENQSPKYIKFSDLGCHCETICVMVCGPGAFLFGTCFRNLWGIPPSTDFGLPGGTLGPILLTFWESLEAVLLQNSKIPGQEMAPTTPSKKQAKIQKHFTENQPKQNIHLLLLFNKAAQLRGLRFFISASAEIPKG